MGTQSKIEKKDIYAPKNEDSKKDKVSVKIELISKEALISTLKNTLALAQKNKLRIQELRLDQEYTQKLQMINDIVNTISRVVASVEINHEIRNQEKAGRAINFVNKLNPKLGAMIANFAKDGVISNFEISLMNKELVKIKKSIKRF